MKKRLVAICVLLIAGLAVACETNQDAAATTATENTEAPVSGEKQAGDQKAPVSQVDIPKEQSMQGMTEGDNFFVVVTPEPNPIPFQEMFELEVRVSAGEQDENPAEAVVLEQVRATMPAHGHGMKTEPKITKVSAGRFRVEGMRFHMQGEGEHGLWVIETVVSQDGTIDKAKFDVQCCRE